MKKLLIIIAVIILLFTACPPQPENENPGFPGQYLFGSVTYNFSAGTIEDYQNGTSPYDFDIYLLGEGISQDPSDGSLSGTGDVVVIGLYSDQQGGITDGLYTFSASGLAFSIEYFDFYYQYNATSGDAVIEVTGEGGEMLISSDGTEYTIAFYLEYPDDTLVVSGNFAGELPVWSD